MTIQFYLLDKSFVVGDPKSKLREKHLAKDHKLLATSSLPSSFSFSSSSESLPLELPLTSSLSPSLSLTLPVTLLFSSLASKQLRKTLSKYKSGEHHADKGRKEEKKVAGKGVKEGAKKVGAVKKANGFVPKFPIVLIPGLGSSALEVWEGKSEWSRDRVWLDPFKIGKIAAAQRLKESASSSPSGSSKSKRKDTKRQTFQSWSSEEEQKLNYYTRNMTGGDLGLDEPSEQKEGKEDKKDKENKALEEQRRWIRYMTLEDGVNDPEGIRVRPMQGLHALDYLCANGTVGKKNSFIFGPLISNLVDVGYDKKNLEGAPYDWRLPFGLLEERDGYFTELRLQIEKLHLVNKEKVVVVTHSMGARVFHYFLNWMDLEDHGNWAETHIHSFLAVAPPFLGAPKIMRTILFGGSFGLDMFLTAAEMCFINRSCASLPYLCPDDSKFQMFPDEFSRVAALKDGQYLPIPWQKLLSQHAAESWKFYEQYAQPDPLFVSLLSPPPVKRLWAIYGVNVLTEVSYYFKSNWKKDGIALDSNADKLGGKKTAKTNPKGLEIQEGVGYEGKDTLQSIGGVQRSGDGTVPYCSLAYGTMWKEECEREGKEFEYQKFEIENAEHREILVDENFFFTFLDLVCHKKA